MAARMWRLRASSAWAREQDGYPAAIPHDPTRHYDMAYDYSGPTWDRTARQAEGGVWARFRPDGEQSYDGSGFAEYRLDGT